MSVFSLLAQKQQALSAKEHMKLVCDYYDATPERRKKIMDTYDDIIKEIDKKLEETTTNDL